ncbi:hypothetical protein [Streptomyces sp. NBC_01205]|uniref:hypothetical protein n=1 Tax=Streptomyces sp. NBC_01205 TaxID=2903771 RepID=UPI002E167E89
MDLSVSFEPVDDRTAVVDVGGEIDVYTAPVLRRALYDVVELGHHAVLTAALEARRPGHSSAVPARLLNEAAAAFMDSAARATARPDWFTTALDSLISVPGPGPAPLAAERHGPGVGAPDGYRLDGYLEQHVRRVRAHRVPPAGFWEAARWARTGDDAHALAAAAADRRRYGVALPLYERAVELGAGRASAARAVLPELTDRAEAAEEVAARDARARAALAAAWGDGAGPATAGAAYERAAEHGSPLAWAALSRIRERAGDRAGSRRAVHRAAQLGAVDAWTALGRVREDRGDTEGAERAYRRGVESGDTAALTALGALLAAAGRTAEARSTYRDAVDAGRVEAWEGLLSVLTALPPRPGSIEVSPRSPGRAWSRSPA